METRLTRRDGWLIAVAVLIAAASLLVGFTYFPRAFPEATIEFTVGREESRERAAALLDALGLDGHAAGRHAARFVYDDNTKVFLEKEMGLAQADSAFSGEIRLWRWGHRWFQVGEREEFRVAIATTGELAAFHHRLEEEAHGREIGDSEAEQLAGRFLATYAAIDLARFELVGSSSKTRPNRVDRTFTWELTGRRWAEAPLRLDVTIQGDRIGGFRTYLKIPETWHRDYEGLRSRNESAGTVAGVLGMLIFVAAVVVFARRIPRRDIRWRTAFGFGLATLVLVFLASLNSLGAEIYFYDTAEDFSAFLVSFILGALGQALGWAVAIFLLTAGGEALYREHYPGKLALGSFFTLHGLRTRRFFLSIIVGYAMTAFFFAYQVGFYLIADALGAWAPADVPYDNLLNTALPWAFVLLIGFRPAVSEEFHSRMFAIPALTRLFRSPVIAVVIAAAIWGFMHSGYPNQPFFMRGLEVGLAGVLIGVIMLRMGILAPLVWHYTVDALYTAYLMLRSGNTYFVISAAVAAGILLLPFLYALVAYLMKRNFVAPEGLKNEDVSAHVAEVASVAKPAEERSLTPQIAYAPVAPRRWGIAFLLTGLIVAGLHLVPVSDAPQVETFHVSRSEAHTLGRAHLDSLGAVLDSLQLVASPHRRVGQRVYRYGAEQIGVARTQELVRRSVAPLSWVLRGFVPLQEEEWMVAMSGRDGRLLGFRHRLPEDAPGDSLSPEAAEGIAWSFLNARGYRERDWRLMESRSEPRPARGDHFVTWEAADTLQRMGAGAVRTRVGVLGDRVGSWGSFVKLPEEWERNRDSRTPLDAARSALVAILMLGAMAYVVFLLVRKQRPGPVHWRGGLRVAVVLGLLQLIAAVLEWEINLSRYPTSEALNLFLLQSLLSRALGILIFSLLIGVAVAFLSALHPNLWASLSWQNRRRFAPDLWLGGLLVLGWILITSRVELLLKNYLPGVYPGVDLIIPPGIGATIALFDALSDGTLRMLFVATLTGLVLYMVRAGGRVRLPGLLLVLVGAAALAAGSGRTPGEVLTAVLVVLLMVGAGLVLARTILRNNVPAYVLGCGVIGFVPVVRQLVSSPVTRLQGGILLVLLAGLALAIFARGARPARD